MGSVPDDGGIELGLCNMMFLQYLRVLDVFLLLVASFKSGYLHRSIGFVQVFQYSPHLTRMQDASRTAID